MRLAYYRPTPVGAWPFDGMEVHVKEFPDEAEHWSRGRAREAGMACGACGKVDFRRDRSDDKPETLPFEVPGPDGKLRFECGGCRPEFVDPDAVPGQRTAEAAEVDICTRVQREIPELDHCDYYEVDYKGEKLCVAVDLVVRGVWAFRDGELCGVDEEADPDLKALLVRNGIRL
ncbi:hypothetical protein ADK56_30910 [Streptomyces sp. MMG1522]|uniref:hypothetical protein n=1 Tax=Streptomyces sp. MMG1522 TaxID=1415545 RepID=UPI0006AE1843|nr:hypothetical protein [Streptomyces sp. MMG1522]KOU46156.1 hypothetical protein ADK56_30910 [Streptomyces sp. MMG1522]